MVSVNDKDAAIKAVVDAIEAAGLIVSASDDYDVEAIADEIFEYDAQSGQFVRFGSSGDFWAAVERHARD